MLNADLASHTTISIYWKKRIPITMEVFKMRYSIVICALMILAALTGAGYGQVAVQPTVAPGGETGYFLIQSIPTGSDLYFDGIFQGETPATVGVSTTGNPEHTIMVTAPGYQTYTQTYNGNPTPGQTITITATLTPSAQTGNIYVTSSPSGALATLDRSQSATTPYTYTNIPVGTHEVSVYLSGYQTFYTSVNVQNGVTTNINAVLTPTITTGSLSVSSTPGGAAVYVDGLYRGVTSTIVGNLAAGQHSVRLSLAGYQDWTGTVSISSGATTYLNPTLVREQTPVYGTASITSNPPGASVYANGVYVGQTRAGAPLVFSQVTPGTYSVLLSKAGYQDYTGNVQVQAGQNYDFTVTLTPVSNPTTGSVSISSSPSGAEVYLNNAFKGLSPLTIDSLSPGSYIVILKLNGYQDWQSSAQVTAGQTTQLSATLLPSSTPTPTPTATGSWPLAVIGASGLIFLLFWRKT
jgi:hypothetical protein